MIPDGNWSDHPGAGATDAGPSWVASIVNAVGGYDNSGNKLADQCYDTVGTQHVPYWQDTVVLVVWDDWGGFYDDVLPWNCQPGPSGDCTGYPGGSGSQYVYGFRVPLLVVSAYTKQVTSTGGYISGTPSQGGETPPFVHDFGSILNFVEYVFGQGGNPLGSPGGIGGINYPYADYLAPDAYPSPGCSKNLCPYGLADFFNFTQTPRMFNPITGAKYATNCFLSPTGTGCFGPNFTPQDPDDDGIDPQ